MSQGRVVSKRSGERFDLYVGRPTILGNPFREGPGVDRARAIRLFRYYAEARMEMDPKFRRAILMCKGKIIACWCAPLPCHADVILELASRL